MNGDWFFWLRNGFSWLEWKKYRCWKQCVDGKKETFQTPSRWIWIPYEVPSGAQESLGSGKRKTPSVKFLRDSQCVLLSDDCNCFMVVFSVIKNLNSINLETREGWQFRHEIIRYLSLVFKWKGQLSKVVCHSHLDVTRWGTWQFPGDLIEPGTPGRIFLSAWEASTDGESGACVFQDGREGMPTNCIRKAEIRNCITRSWMTR